MQRLEDLGIKYNGADLRQQMLYPLGVDALAGAMTVFIDCNPDIVQQRVKERQRKNFDIDVESKVRHLYLTQINFVENVRIVDGSRSQEQVAREINSQIKAYLERKS